MGAQATHQGGASIQEYFECAGRSTRPGPGSVCSNRRPSRTSGSDAFFSKSGATVLALLKDEKSGHLDDRFTQEPGLLQRCDLHTRRKLEHPLYFCRLDDTRQHAHVTITDNGDVIMDDGKNVKGKKWELRVPDTRCTTDGPAAKYVLRVSSEDTPNLGHIVQLCESPDQISECLLGLLRAGAESLNISIGREMLSLHFDKMHVVQEHDHIQYVESADLPNCHLVTGITWVTIFHYKLLPAPDPLQREFDRLRDGKHTKNQLIREMESRGVDPSEIERFKETASEATFGGEMKAKSRQYYHLRASQAHDLKFFKKQVMDPSEFDPVTEAPEDGEEAAALQTDNKAQFLRDDEFFTVSDIIQDIVGQVRAAGKSPRNWEPLLSWEPLRITTVKECMHLAYQNRALDDEEGYVRMALRAIEIVAKKARMNDSKAAAGAGGGGDSEVSLDDDERDAILACNKAMLDRLIMRYLERTIHVDRFEESFVQRCEGMLDIIDTLINLAQRDDNPEKLVLYYRTKADYLRYMHVWLPSKRTNEIEIQKIYELALETSQALRPRHITTISTWVNLALFHAEVKRDAITAADECRRGLGVEGARTLYEAPTPSEIFNWHLMSLNLEAFESRLVVIVVRFKKDSLAAHAAAATAAAASGSGALHRESVHSGVALQEHAMAKTKSASYATVWEADEDEGVAPEDGLDAVIWNACGARGTLGWQAGLQGSEHAGAMFSACAYPEHEEDEDEDNVAIGRNNYMKQWHRVHKTNRRRSSSGSFRGSGVDEMECSAIRAWLRSCPLRRLRNEKDEPPVPDLQHLYWLEHVEVAPGWATEEGKPPLSARSSVIEKDDWSDESDEEEDAAQAKAVVAVENGADEGPAFLVACAAKLKPPEDGRRVGADPSRAHAWHQDLCNALVKWSPPSYDKNNTKYVRVLNEPQLAEVAKATNSDANTPQQPQFEPRQHPRSGIRGAEIRKSPGGAALALQKKAKEPPIVSAQLVSASTTQLQAKTPAGLAQQAPGKGREQANSAGTPSHGKTKETHGGLVSPQRRKGTATPSEQMSPKKAKEPKEPVNKDEHILELEAQLASAQSELEHWRRSSGDDTSKGKVVLQLRQELLERNVEVHRLRKLLNTEIATRSSELRDTPSSSSPVSAPGVTSMRQAPPAESNASVVESPKRTLRNINGQSGPFCLDASSQPPKASSSRHCVASTQPGRGTEDAESAKSQSSSLLPAGVAGATSKPNEEDAGVWGEPWSPESMAHVSADSQLSSPTSGSNLECADAERPKGASEPSGADSLASGKDKLKASAASTEGVSNAKNVQADIPCLRRRPDLAQRIDNVLGHTQDIDGGKPNSGGHSPSAQRRQPQPRQSQQFSILKLMNSRDEAAKREPRRSRRADFQPIQQFSEPPSTTEGRGVIASPRQPRPAGGPDHLNGETRAARSVTKEPRADKVLSDANRDGSAMSARTGHLIDKTSKESAAAATARGSSPRPASVEPSTQRQADDSAGTGGGTSSSTTERYCVGGRAAGASAGSSVAAAGPTGAGASPTVVVSANGPFCAWTGQTAPGRSRSPPVASKNDHSSRRLPVGSRATPAALAPNDVVDAPRTSGMSAGLRSPGRADQRSPRASHGRYLRGGHAAELEGLTINAPAASNPPSAPSRCHSPREYSSAATRAVGNFTRKSASSADLFASASQQAGCRPESRSKLNAMRDEMKRRRAGSPSPAPAETREEQNHLTMAVAGLRARASETARFSPRTRPRLNANAAQSVENVEGSREKSPGVAVGERVATPSAVPNNGSDVGQSVEFAAGCSPTSPAVALGEPTRQFGTAPGLGADAGKSVALPPGSMLTNPGVAVAVPARTPSKKLTANVGQSIELAVGSMLTGPGAAQGESVRLPVGGPRSPSADAGHSDALRLSDIARSVGFCGGRIEATTNIEPPLASARNNRTSGFASPRDLGQGQRGEHVARRPERCQGSKGFTPEDTQRFPVFEQTPVKQQACPWMYHQGSHGGHLSPRSNMPGIAPGSVAVPLTSRCQSPTIVGVAGIRRPGVAESMAGVQRPSVAERCWAPTATPIVATGGTSHVGSKPSAAGPPMPVTPCAATFPYVAPNPGPVGHHRVVNTGAVVTGRPNSSAAFR